MTSVSDVEAFAPQLASIDDAVITTCVLRAEAEINRTAWANLAEFGVLNLTCHFLTMHQRQIEAGASGNGVDGAIMGPTRKTKIGPLETEYAVSALSGNVNTGFGVNTSLSQTPYGLEYLRLRRSVFGSRV